jgi:antitoxin VapB
MGMSLRNPDAERLAREVARRTGTSMTEAIVGALGEKLERLEHEPARESCLAEIMRIAARCSALPTLDTRPEEEILGYETSEG